MNSKQSGLPRGAVFLLFLLIALLCLSGALAEDAPQAFNSLCVLAKDVRSAPVYSQPSGSSEKCYTLSQGEALVVVGDTGRYYRVIADGQTGYIAYDKVKLSGAPCETALPESIAPEARFVEAIPFRKETHLELAGSLKADRKLDTVFLYVWDERQLAVEQAYILHLDSASDTVAPNQLKKFLNLTKWTGGRKTIVIQGAADGERVVLFRSPAYICTDNSEPYSVTKLCKVPYDSLLDTKISTAWAQSASRRSVTVEIPPTAEASFITLEWKTLPDSVQADYYDANKALISSETKATGYYSDWLSLPEGACMVTITPTGQEVALSTLRVYSETYSRHAVQQWEDGPEKLDILLVSTHQDDELLFLGGTAADYTARGAKVNVLYTADCGRMRIREALDGLWTLGLRGYPIFLGLPDIYTMSQQEADAKWAKYDLPRLMVRAYRQYRPEVVVTQSFSGEYGHGQHKVTVQTAVDAVALAADPGYDPESAAAYGVWQVKKLYVHSYEENQVVMDWTRPLDEGGVITPLFLTKEAYDKHRTQHAYFSIEKHGVEYDNTVFGLYFTAVGPDEAKNDFLEHIDWQK